VLTLWKQEAVEHCTGAGFHLVEVFCSEDPDSCEDQQGLDVLFSL
jgi:hypothetical protein